jgi:hypothetical protein
MRRLAAALLALSVLAAAGAPQRKPSRRKQMSDSQVLPVEAGSRSELLAARNIFSIETVSLSPSPWKPDPDSGLEARVLTLEARLLEVYKGDAKRAGPFRAELPQWREDALTVSDFHGFWSHAEIEAGKKYIVFSNGVSTDPAALLDDANMLDLRPADAPLITDIAMAVDMERRLVPVDTREKLVEVMKMMYNEREHATGLFGRYVCDRVSRHFESMEDAMQTGFMRVVTASGTTETLREALVDCLYDESAEQDLTEDRAIALLRRFLSWAQQPEAAPMLDRMLQVHLYNLIFRPGEAPLPVGKVVPDAEERSRLEQVFAAYPSARAKEIVAWLKAAPAR